MEIALESQEMVAVGPISHRGTLKLLPVGKKGKQKVCVGDDTGAVTCFEMKRGAFNTVFASAAAGKEVSSLALGGPVGKKDKVFVAMAQQIKGVSKKGKEFFSFNSNLTETITSLFVEELKIWTCGEYVYNLFDNGTDTHFFMSPDRINDLVCSHISRDTEYDALLACQDRFVRCIQGSTPILEAAIDAPAVSLKVYGGGGGGGAGSGAGAGSAAKRQLLYGTQTGVLGLLNIDPTIIRRGFTAMPPLSKSRASITCMDVIDFTKDGVPDIIVGRDDGDLTVYGFDTSDTPTEQFNTNISESVQSVAAGRVCKKEFDEMVVCSYSGRLTSYTMEPLSSTADATDNHGRAVADTQRENRIAKIRKELEGLKQKVRKEQEKLSKYADEFIPVASQFKVKTSFVLDPQEGAYKFTVELPLAIDVVALQSSIPISILDAETNAAIVSRSPPVKSDGNVLLATYRCQDTTNRLEMNVRTVEGQYGDLQALVIARMEPKTAQMVKVTIKPLSMHHRMQEDVDDRAMNTLRLTGTFTMSQMHEWVCFCLPDVPARLQDKEVTMNFRNCYLGTLLVATYRKGEAVFRSDSVSTIAILKEVITRQATALKVRINLSFDILDETVIHYLRLIHPKLTYTLGLAQKVDLIDALKEIKLQEGDTSFLAPEYTEVIEHGARFKREFQNQPRALEMLYGLVTDLFVDKHKFRGRDVQHKIPALVSLLQRYNFEEVCRFFEEPA